MIQKNKIIFLLLLIASFNVSNAVVIAEKTIAKSSKKIGKQVFYFGKQVKKSKGVIIVSKSLSFDSVVGYGFDFNTATNVMLNKNSFATEAPTYFSVQVPEGNYQVSVTFGSTIKNTNTTIKAESRRLMLDQKQLKKGETA